MEDMINLVFDALSERKAFRASNEAEILSSLQGMIPQDSYDRAEPLLNELRDTEQRLAFLNGIKTGARMIMYCLNTD